MTNVQIASGTNGTQPDLLLAGQIRNSITGHPVSELTLTARITGGNAAPVVVGSGGSGPRGSFLVQPVSGAEEALRALPQAGTTLTLLVAPPGERTWFQTPDLARRAFGRTVAVEVPVPKTNVAQDHWHQLAARLAERRISTLHEIVRQLVFVPPGESVVGDWPIELRHALALDLERAFIDPVGVLAKNAVPPTFYQAHVHGAWATYLERSARRALPRCGTHSTTRRRNTAATRGSTGRTGRSTSTCWARAKSATASASMPVATRTGTTTSLPRRRTRPSSCPTATTCGPDSPAGRTVSTTTSSRRSSNAFTRTSRPRTAARSRRTRCSFPS